MRVMIRISGVDEDVGQDFVLDKPLPRIKGDKLTMGK